MKATKGRVRMPLYHTRSSYSTRRLDGFDSYYTHLKASSISNWFEYRAYSPRVQPR